MSVSDVKSKAPKKASGRKPTAAEQAAVKAALDAATIEYAPLSAFAISPLNARTIPYSSESVSNMADSIGAVGLLQNLVCHVLSDGTIAVAAGGKRLTGMQLLLSQQRMASDFKVPFKRVEEEIAALVSFIENDQRSDMHPAEQIASFGVQSAQGKTAEQIGAATGYSTRHVQRMLKLANLAPSLLKLLADDQLTLEQCQVLCLEDDQARQVRVFEDVSATWPNLPVSVLKRQITDKEISISDERFLFVGRQAYEAAGGIVREDLFSQEEGEGTADLALLETLTLQKLDAVAQEICAKEGWTWSMGRKRSIAGYHDEYHLLAVPEALYIGDEEALRDELYAKSYAFEADGDDEGYSAACDAINAIEEAAENRAWTPEDRAVSGVVVGFDHAGELSVQRGVMRVADMPQKDGGESEQEAKPVTPEKLVVQSIQKPDPAEGITLPLLTRMSSERTLAVQAALLAQPEKALSLLVWQLCTHVFGSGSPYRDPFEIRVSVSHYGLTANAPSGEKGTAYAALLKEKARLKALLPSGWQKDFTTFFEMSSETLSALMVFCVSCSIDGVQTRECQRTSASRLDALETAIGFHMRDWWQPTKANFFTDLKHAQIVDALNEAGLTGAASDAAKMKKGDAAELAEERLLDTRWVPAWMKAPEDKATDVAEDHDIETLNAADAA
ncbi:ParB/RepB/Spo0J family partition protein [Erwinia amylovora]|uniref:ParB/RepB/Spo0J family partition protein n=1 Tax=Erwinia amylovora TaxID=552 RepID=UPI000C086B0B|nr:ParB/RepB/Spo0J family partition protein [Erwinia amylovora]